MKKVVFASLLAAVSLAASSSIATAQNPVNLGSNQGAQVTLPAAEANAYNNAMTQTAPQAKASALEGYLTAYPQSSLKGTVLEQLMLAYSAFDPVKTQDAADRLLQVDPSNLRALTLEVYLHKAAADQKTDADKQTELDKASDFAQRGLKASKPRDMSDSDFKALQSNATPIFYGAVAAAAFNRKDMPTAIANYKLELQSVPVADTAKPGVTLQDTFYLGLAYYQSTPPDYVNCTFYATRAATFAPEPYKSQMQPTATYCYKKYHGSAGGYETVTAAAQSNLFPPANFTITPAPSTADIVHGIITSTPDLAALAVGDKEFILQNGSPEDAAKVWDVIKGKTVEIPGTVIAATESAVQLAVSEDAVHDKKADYTFQLKTPLKTLPTVGSTATFNGTYASYTASPIMITMSDAEEVGKKVAPKKAAAPVHHAPAKKHR